MLWNITVMDLLMFIWEVLRLLGRTFFSVWSFFVVLWMKSYFAQLFICLVYEILFCLVILDSLMGAERDGWDTELTFDFCAKWLLSRPNLSAPRNYGTSIR